MFERLDKSQGEPGGTLVWVAFWAFIPMAFLCLAAARFAPILTTVLDADFPASNYKALGRINYALTHPAYLASPNMADSWAPMERAVGLLHNQGDSRIYETLFFEKGIRFQYPTSSLLPIEALGSLDAGIAALNTINFILYLVNALAIAWLALRCMKSLASATTHGPGLAIVGFIAGLTFYPILRAENLGQIQIWIDLMFTLACLAWMSDRRLLAGVLIGLATTIKPQFGMLFVWALAWREWRFTRGMLFAMIPVFGLATLRYGIHNQLDYLSVLSELSRIGESHFSNNSINGIVNRLLGYGPNLHWREGVFTPYHPLVHALTILASVAALLAAMLPAFRSGGRRAGRFDFATAALCTVLGSPIAWEHHYGVALPVFVMLLVSLLHQQGGPARTRSLAWLGIAWFLMANFIPFSNLLANSWLNVLQAYVFIGGLVLLVLVTKQLQSQRPGAASASPLLEAG